MAKNLTHRQQEFLNHFLDLYQEMEEPIHYTLLADRLSLGKVTAYEMLRLLEEHGLVQSEYYLPDQERGPGRSSVLFRPTAEASRLLHELNGGFPEDDDWGVVKERILHQLRAGKAAGYEDLLTDLLARIPEQGSPLVYLTEMTTATLLVLGGLRDSAEAGGLADRLRRIGLPGEIGLSALAGVNAALTLMERVNRRISSFLLSQSGKYQTMLSQIGEENRRRLGDFAREVAKIVSD
ncbi:MAG: hypothetical protein IBX69_09005 [Anaerolineales bacterium]|nr:hypothetical protein [Anaerolineales bacterium]